MKKFITWTGYGAILLALALLALNYYTPQDASNEWIYTLEWINLILIPLPVAAAIFFAVAGIVLAFKSRHGRLFAILCCLFCCLFFVIPWLMPDYQLLNWKWQYFLSACWSLAFLLAGICLFILATRTNALIASLLCVTGSLFLGLAAMEIALLFSSQYGDGMTNLSAESRHASQTRGVPEYANWSDDICGKKPAPSENALPSFHRLATFERDIFDVQYTFNANGWRILPKQEGTAKNDLLLFGCSFTFGFGLEDEQTWAWQLAKALGPDWRLENYSANAYSVNHMLCLLEHNLIEIPPAENRYALFLAIDHQIRRNEFFTNTPHYIMNGAGEAEAGGKPGFNWVFTLPVTFNGSQLAREASSFITGMAMKQPEKHVPLYLAMLKKSDELLRDKYRTQLIVLLWPDMEKLAPALKEMGISTILARSMLRNWDTPEDPGWKYRIDRFYEPHPNREAATELAAGLTAYFRHLDREKGD